MGEEPEKVSRPLLAACRRATLRVQGAPGRVSDQRGEGVRDGIGYGRQGRPGMRCGPSAVAGALVGIGDDAAAGRRRVPESRCRGPHRDGISRAACGRYAHGIAGGEMVPPAERLRWCTARQLVEEGKLMLNCEEKVERLELLDALADAGRLAKGLDQLLESLAHADQLDPLDVEGILALRSISQRCAGRIEDAARILEAQNEILYAEERANFRPRENQEMRTRTKETI